MTAKVKKGLVIGAVVITLLLISAQPGMARTEALIRQLEEDNNPKLTAYPDAGHWAIGYGSQYNWDQNRPVRQGDRIDSAATADRFMRLELQQINQALTRLITRPQNASQLVALRSFVYNIGVPQFQQSDMLDLINAGAPKQQIADQFDRWIYSQGRILNNLVQRRQIEKQIYLS